MGENLVPYFIVTSWNGKDHYAKEIQKPERHRLSAQLGVREEFFQLTSAESELSLDALSSLYRAGTLCGQSTILEDN